MVRVSYAENIAVLAETALRLCYRQLIISHIVSFYGLHYRAFIVKRFDAHCCYMGTAIKHPEPDLVKMSFVIFYIRTL